MSIPMGVNDMIRRDRIARNLCISCGKKRAVISAWCIECYTKTTEPDNQQLQSMPPKDRQD